jgi:hypothetical protein
MRLRSWNGTLGRAIIFEVLEDDEPVSLEIELFSLARCGETYAARSKQANKRFSRSMRYSKPSALSAKAASLSTVSSQNVDAKDDNANGRLKTLIEKWLDQKQAARLSRLLIQLWYASLVRLDILRPIF